VQGPNGTPVPELQFNFPVGGWTGVVSKMHVTARRVDVYCGPALPPYQWQIVAPLSNIAGRTWPIIEAASGPVPM